MPVLVACAIGVAILLLLVWASARSAITIAVAEIRMGRSESRVAESRRACSGTSATSPRARASGAQPCGSCASETERGSRFEARSASSRYSSSATW